MEQIITDFNNMVDTDTDTPFMGDTNIISPTTGPTNIPVPLAQDFAHAIQSVMNPFHNTPSNVLPSPIPSPTIGLFGSDDISAQMRRVNCQLWIP
jgi:PAB1-binding protein PBP1